MAPGISSPASPSEGARGPHCRRCRKLIPPGTEIHTPSGYFCGMDCAEAHSDIEARVFTVGTMSRRRLASRGLAGLAVLAGLCCIFYGIMYFVHGMTDPKEMVAWLLDSIRKAIAVGF